MRSSRLAVVMLFGLACSFAATVTGAQDYPAKPVRLIVAFPPGSATDIVTRVVAQKLAEHLGQPFVVENRGGAAGNIGAQLVAKAAADGYTVLSTSSAFAINLSLYAAPGYASKEFVPIARTGATPSVITVHPSLPAKTLRELFDLAKTQPLSYASAGTGTGGHILMEWLKSQAKADIAHVPFTPAAAVNAVVGNQAPVGVNSLPPATPHVKAGRLRPLAITSDVRSATMPDVPTMAEAGYPGFTDVIWLALFAPVGTSGTIVAKLNAEINRALEVAEVREKLASIGFDAKRNSQQDFERELSEEIAKYGRAIKTLGVKVD